MDLNDYDVFISQSPRGGRLCENQIIYQIELIFKSCQSVIKYPARSSVF